MSHHLRRAAIAALFLSTSCSTTRPLISLTSALPITSSPAAALEVSTRSTGVPDPVLLGGVAYGGLEESLGHAVASALAPWAAEHAGARPGGWHLLVELIQADAERTEGRVKITLAVRATLRTRIGNNYLAQTQAHCRVATVAAAEASAPVFYNCMMSVGRELAGWLGGVEP
jgi:hypothetical protein